MLNPAALDLIKNRKFFRILLRAYQGKISKTRASGLLNVSRKTLYKHLSKLSYLLIEQGTKIDTLLDLLKRNYDKKQLFKDEILLVSFLNPGYGPRRISLQLKMQGKEVSQKTVWRVLKEFDLATKVQREAFYLKYKVSKRPLFDTNYLRLASRSRKSMIEAVLSGQKAGDICKEYRVSRKTLAKWKARYEKAQEKGDDLLLALSDRNPTGVKHYNGVGKATENAILKLVVENPAPSSHQISSRLSFVGNHGVQGVLTRHNLNKYEARFTYAKEHQASRRPFFAYVLSRIKLVWNEFLPSLAPAPPPTGFKITAFFKFFFISSFITLLLSLGISSWVNFFKTS